MDRRTFLAGTGTVLLAALGPRIATSQTSSRTPTVGFLALIPPGPQDVWVRRLKELGWIEGKNILIERAFAEGRLDSLSALAADLVRKQVDVIYARGPDAAVEAVRATKTIPIVFQGPAFPVEQGLVDSYARPGRNVTGVAWNSAYVKQLEFVRQILHGVTRIAHFLLPTAMRKVNGGDFAGLIPEMEATAKRMGIALKSFRVAAPEDVDLALKAIKAWRAQALITYATPLTFLEKQRIVSFANANHIPSFFDWRGFTEAGGLFSYGPLVAEMAVQAAGQVDRILRGARPDDLPVELPTRYEFVINLKTAKALGLTIPQLLLQRADEVIQ
jgi:putative ABC transport system substrate-binding protein